MKKIILAFAVMVFSTAGARAQNSPSLSLGINVGVPTQEGYSISFGADLQADFAVAPTTRITGSVGYQNFSVKNDFGSGTVYFVPVMAGAKFSLGSGQLYGHAQIGYGFAEGGGGSLAYSPAIGYYFSPNFDASVEYLAFSDDNFALGTIGVRLAYNF